jgi:hypothetical protein
MFVLIAAIVVTTMGAALVRAMVIETQQPRIDEWGAQADWLVEAAGNRAAAHLASDTNYQGETWQVEATRLDGRHAAEVDIAVTPIAVTQPEDTTARAVAITARYPTGTPIFVSRKKTIEVRFANTTVNNTETPAGEDMP